MHLKPTPWTLEHSAEAAVGWVRTGRSTGERMNMLTTLKSPRTRTCTRRLAGLQWCCALLALLACLPSILQAVSGMEGTFEFACDAPWRMEPTRNPDGTFSYGDIPIQITIHDAREAADDNIIDHYYWWASGGGIERIKLPANLTSLGRFQAVRIRQ